MNEAGRTYARTVKAAGKYHPRPKFTNDQIRERMLRIGREERDFGLRNYQERHDMAIVTLRADALKREGITLERHRSPCLPTVAQALHPSIDT